MMRQAVGLTVQFGVAQLPFAKDQRHGVRCGVHLGFDQVLNRCVGKGHCRVIPVMQQVLTLGGVQQRQLTQRGLGIASQGTQHLIEMPDQPHHAVLAEALAIEVEAHCQRLVGLNHQGQRIVGLLLIDHAAERQPFRRRLLQHLRNRVVLEHQDRIEQRFATVTGPALDIVERRVLMFAQGQVEGLQLAHPIRHRLLGARATHHRQGVDEQAKLLLDPRQLRRTSGDDGAERHAGLAGIALQQQQPGSLHQRIQGHPLLTGKGVESQRLLAVECVMPVDITVQRGLRLQHVGKPGRRFQRGELHAPEGFAGHGILTLQPFDVIPVAGRRLRGHLAVITLQHLAQQARAAPAVHQDVMAGVDQVMAVVAGAQQGQAQQRFLLQVETALTVGVGPGFERRGAMFHRAPVLLGQRHDHLLADHLQRFAQVTDEAGPQHVVLVDHRLPGRLEARDIQTAHIHPHLVDVVGRFFLVQAVEQHALLHRRQRVDIGDLRRGDTQAVDVLLVEVGQREVRRRRRGALGVHAVFDHLAQRGAVLIGQPLQQFVLEHRGAEAPFQFELAAIDLAADADQAVQRRIEAVHVAAALARRPQQAVLLGEAAVELAQIVEDDRTLGQTGQRFTGGAAAQVAQHAVADALVGDRPQLFLDGLDRVGQGRPRAEPDRVDRGEPADSAGDVQRFEQVFAAMPFQLDQHRRLPGPGTDHPGQCRQQQVVDLCTVGRRGILQQLPGQLAVQPGGDAGDIPAARLGTCLAVRQFIADIGQLRLPVAQLLLQFGAAGIVTQVLGPALERTGLGRQCHRLALGKRGISVLQVFQQDAPGHAVHHQVMDHQQQALRAIGQFREHRTQQVTALQVEAALGLLSQRLQLIGMLQLALPEQPTVVALAVDSVPGTVFQGEAKAQGIVLHQQRLQGFFHQGRLQHSGRFEHHRLVPVVALRDVAFEEPVLDWRQRRRTVHGGLIDDRGFGQTRHRGQALHGLALEQVLGREEDPGLTGTADHLNGDDRVAAQLEEVVGQTDLLQLEHIAPDRRQLLFQLAAWRDIGRLGLSNVRLWQGLAVELAVRGQR